MEFKKVNKELKEYKQIKKLYRTSFPLIERAPFRVLLKEKGIGQFFSVYDPDWVGMVHLCVYKDIVYIFYFAIVQNKRNQGYGKKVIQKILEIYNDKCVFLAIEPLDASSKNYEQRVARHNFYLSCGLMDNPLKIKEGTVIYSMMSTSTPSIATYNEMMDSYMGKWLRKRIDMRILE